MEGRHPVKTYKSDNWVDGKTVYLLKDTLEIGPLVKKAADNGAIGIKVTIEDGPTPPFVERIPVEYVRKIVNEAKKYDLKVFAHISDNTELRMGLAAGVTDFVHYIGVDLHKAHDKPLIDTLIRSHVNFVTTFMILKGLVYPSFPQWTDRPEIKTIFAREIENLKGNPELPKASKEIFKFFLGREEGSLEDVLKLVAGDLKFLYENGINIALGTDIGQPYIFPGISLHEEMEMMEMLGFDPIDIIKMATHNAAKMLRVLDELRTIEKGKWSDMILLDKNPQASIRNSLTINTIFKAGREQFRLKE